MKTTLTIEGMSCEHCVKHATNALLEIPGVCSANVELKSKKAVVESNFRISDEEFKKAIADVGYELKEITQN